MTLDELYRNEALLAQWLEGDSICGLARRYGISEKRASTIVKREGLQRGMASEIYTKTLRGTLSTREVAGLLGVHPETLRRALRRGLLPACRTPGGGRWRIPAEVVAALIKARPLPK